MSQVQNSLAEEHSKYEEEFIAKICKFLGICEKVHATSSLIFL